MKLKILVGTMTGTATLVAQAIQMECAGLLSAIEIEAMDDLGISVFDADNPQEVIYLICTSTYGAGDVPANAQALYQSLDTEPRYLGHVRYGDSLPEAAGAQWCHQWLEEVLRRS